MQFLYSFLSSVNGLNLGSQRIFSKNFGLPFRRNQITQIPLLALKFAHCARSFTSVEVTNRPQLVRMAARV